MTRAESNLRSGRTIWAAALAAWLVCAAALSWLHLLDLPDGLQRLREQTSAFAFGPLLLDWDTTPLRSLDGWQAGWAANFGVGVLSVALLAAYAVRPGRLTACLSAVGLLWWIGCGIHALPGR
ncbi:MAG: hypothetical protein ACYTGV_10270 [Planctomycetota bacterium]|jgi:hypothetical protein